MCAHIDQTAVRVGGHRCDRAPCPRVFQTGDKARLHPRAIQGWRPALIDVVAGTRRRSLASRSWRRRSAGGPRARPGDHQPKRSAVAPDIPTLIESGLSDFDVQGWFGWLAPAKTPAPIVARLNAEIANILKDPVVRERLVAQGSDPAGGTPEEFGRFIQSEYERWAKVIKTANIKFDR